MKLKRLNLRKCEKAGHICKRGLAQIHSTLGACVYCSSCFSRLNWQTDYPSQPACTLRSACAGQCCTWELNAGAHWIKTLFRDAMSGLDGAKRGVEGEGEVEGEEGS